jgi:hypothetical protein
MGHGHFGAQGRNERNRQSANGGAGVCQQKLAFENGQRVSLERVRSIRFDAIYLENSSADGVVTLLDGRDLMDAIDTWNCPVTGTNELGSLAIQLKDIKRIDFHR